jgi:hypothetical protein
MQRWTEIPQVSIQRNVSTRVLEVNDIPVAKGGNLDLMDPAIRYGIDGFAFNSAKLVIQTRMKVVGTKFREVSGKVISNSWLYRGLEVSFLNFLPPSPRNVP